MYFFKKRDHRVRQFFKRNELFYIVCQFLQKNELQIDLGRRSFFLNKISFLFKANYYTKVRNYCLLTKSSHTVYKSFRLSRHKLRLLAINGHLHGIHKN